MREVCTHRTSPHAGGHFADFAARPATHRTKTPSPRYSFFAAVFRPTAW